MPTHNARRGKAKEMKSMNKGFPVHSGNKSNKKTHAQGRVTVKPKDKGKSRQRTHTQGKRRI